MTNKTEHERYDGVPAPPEETGFAMSRAAAEQRLEQEGYPDIDQVVERVKSKADWPDEIWEELKNDVMAVRSGRKRRRLGTAFSGFLQRHHGLATACAMVLVFCMLLALFPESTTLAWQVYAAVIQVSDDKLKVQPLIQHENEADAGPADGQHGAQSGGTVVQLFASAHEFTETTGRTPFMLNASHYSCEKIEYIKDRHGVEQLCIHYAHDGGEILTTQIWNSADDMLVNTDSRFLQFPLGDERVVYYSIDEDDGSRAGIVVLEDCMLMIGADASLPIQEFLGLFVKD